MNRVRLSALALLVGGLCTVSAAHPAPESVLYQGEHGGVHSFQLRGGAYSLYVYASFPDLASQDSCIFVGTLQRLSPTTDSVELGGPVPITVTSPFKLGPAPLTLPAGLYQLDVTSQTNCHWHFSLEAA